MISKFYPGTCGWGEYLIYPETRNCPVGYDTVAGPYTLKEAESVVRRWEALVEPLGT